MKYEYKNTPDDRRQAAMDLRRLAERVAYRMIGDPVAGELADFVYAAAARLEAHVKATYDYERDRLLDERRRWP